MVISQFDNVKVTALSVAIPTKKINIESFYDSFGKDLVTKFSEMSGVKQISHSIPSQTASDLGCIAAQNIFNSGKVKKEDIGVLIFVSQKPDYRFPATSFVLQRRLNLNHEVICHDISLACSGFIYGMQNSLSLLNLTPGKKALLITADTSYKTMSPQDRTMIMLFGDSGSAVVLEKDLTRNNEFKFAFRTNGTRFKSIITPAGAFRNRDLKPLDSKWSDGILRNDYNTHMKGMSVFEFSITDVPKLINDYFKHTETNSNNFDYFVLHQANLYILNQLSRKCKIPMDKIPISIDRFGNNSSNSIPLVLSDHFCGKNEFLSLFISGFGAGLSWGCGSIDIDAEAIFPIIESDEFY
jgi:3-oxoacyl-[acyl-carrier-protein] synthase-3